MNALSSNAPTDSNRYQALIALLNDLWSQPASRHTREQMDALIGLIDNYEQQAAGAGDAP